MESLFGQALSKSLHDQAIPSGNSVSTYNLMRLQAVDGERWHDLNKSLLQHGMALNQRSPLASPFINLTLLEQNSGAGILHAYGAGDSDFQKWRKNYHPHILSVVHQAADGSSRYQFCSGSACEIAEDDFVETDRSEVTRFKSLVGAASFENTDKTDRVFANN